MAVPQHLQGWMVMTVMERREGEVRLAVQVRGGHWSREKITAA